MGKGILRLDSHIVAQWFVAGKNKYDTKSLLKLPESYAIEDISLDTTAQHICLTVSGPDLPEIGSTEIQATFSKAQAEDGQWHVPESYKLSSLKAIVQLPLECKEA